MKSSDKATSTLTVVPLGTTFFHGSLISHELLERIHSLGKNEKILLLYNRRGSGRAWICEDCGYFPLCPHCDIAMAYHTFPSTQLVCHHCSYRSGLIDLCPSCTGATFHEVGIGIQRVETDIMKILGGDQRVVRIDSDRGKDKTNSLDIIDDAKIILSTYAGLTLLHATSVNVVVFLLFESDLTLPDYRMEEDLYHALEYAKKSGKEVIIQTYMPEHPLLTILTEGNYRDFLSYMSAERERFHYPPYNDFVTIRVHDGSKQKLQDMVAKLVNKIDIVKTDDVFVAYDREVRERIRDEWVEKIILKGKNLQLLLDKLETELVRNRSITLEWR